MQMPSRISHPAPANRLARQHLIEAHGWPALPDDREAFNTLFARYQGGVLGLLIRRLGRLEDAQDALAVTFLKAWRGRAGYRGEASAKVWLYSIAAHVAIDMLRVRRRRQVEGELELLEPEQLDQAAGADPDPAALVLHREEIAGARAAITDALDHLPSEDRRILQLFYYEGRTYQEIGVLVGATFSQIRGRLHRIRARVKRDMLYRQSWQPD